MTPKLKLFLLVLGAAFLSALITLFFQVSVYGGHYPKPILRGGWSIPATDFSTTNIQGAYPEDLSAQSSMPVNKMMMEDEVGMAQDSGMISEYYPMPPIYNRDDALDVDQRAEEMFASQSVVVSDVGAYLARNKDFIESVAGRVLSYSQGTQAGQGLFAKPISYGYLDARVPMDKFDEVNQQLGQNVQKVVYQTVSAHDVTGEVVAIDEQLQKLQDQLLEAELNHENAATDAEKRRYELEISRLERQIDSIKQNQQNLDQKIAYATISVSVANNEEYFVPTWRSSWANTVWSIFNSMSVAAMYIGLLVIYTILYSLIWWPIMLGVRFVRRKMSKKTG